jgi:uncharacterized protein YifE (UPF0438 family)
VNIPEDHKTYLDKKGYSLNCSRVEIFDDDETNIFYNYGYWLDALAEGKIKPITQAQENFINAAHGNKDAETPYEKLWIKLKKRRQWEQDNKGLINWRNVRVGPITEHDFDKMFYRDFFDLPPK